MKCSVFIFVLSMVVLAAQPGEGFLHLISHVINGVSHGIHGLQLDQQEMDQQQKDEQQLNKRSFKYQAVKHRIA
uniref:Dicentracin-like n=1 Tax=Poecilia reticulata TaxID=8081 RepID=A0A3P9PTJ9_POERE